jgi:hypothetical protein
MRSEQSGNRNGLAIQSHKLNFVSFAAVVYMDDGPNVPGRQTFSGQINGQYNRVVFSDHFEDSAG